MTTNELISLIRSEADARGVAEATLCKMAVGNNRLFRHLLSGGTCTLDVAERFVRYVSDNKAAAQ